MRITNTCPISTKKAARYNASITACKPQTVKSYIKVPGTNKLKQVTTSISSIIA